MNPPFLNFRAAIFTALLVVMCAVVTAHTRAGGQDSRLPKRAGHINDFAEVLDQPTKERLETVLDRLKDKTHLDFVVSTI